MFCPVCGADNDDVALDCANCGRELPRYDHDEDAPPPVIPTYLAPAILCTIFCCMPAGIPGIVYAAQVTSKIQARDYAGAEVSSRNAKTWCWVSFGLGLGVLVIYMVIGLAGMGFRHGDF